MRSRTFTRTAFVATILAAVAPVLVVVAPAANAAAVSIQPDDWKFKRNVTKVTYSGRGYVSRINDAAPNQIHVSMVGAAGSGGNTSAKVGNWVRANHGKPARVCAVVKGRRAGVGMNLAINYLNKGTQSSNGGFKTRSATVGTAWTRVCMDFTVVGRTVYDNWAGSSATGPADVWVQNLETNLYKDLYLDFVTLATR